jgi:hypothetical protein
MLPQNLRIFLKDGLKNEKLNVVLLKKQISDIENFSLNFNR